MVLTQHMQTTENEPSMKGLNPQVLFNNKHCNTASASRLSVIPSAYNTSYCS